MVALSSACLHCTVSIFLLLGITSQLVAGDLLAPFTFTLDLSKSPETRWTGAVEMVVAANGWDFTFGPFFEPDAAFWPPMPSSVGEELEAILRDSQAGYYGELQGLAASFANVGHPEVNTTVLSMWAYMYELAHVTNVDTSPQKTTSSGKNTHRWWSRFEPRSSSGASACAGLLVLPTDPTQPILHGRNLDLPPLSLRNVTMIVNVVKNTSSSPPDYQYQLLGGLWWAGSDFTSRRDLGVTVEGNWKTEAANLTLHSMMDRIRALRMPLGLIFRVVHEQRMLLDDVINWVSLNISATPAPFYLIMSGVGRQGAVLSKSFVLNASLRVHYVNDSTPNWYLFQTNNDWWIPGPDPGDGCSSAIRNQVAENFLHDVGRAVGSSGMGVWMTLNQFPVHNADTAFTAIMSVAASASASVPSLIAYTHQAIFGYPLMPWCPPPNTDPICSACGP